MTGHIVVGLAYFAITTLLPLVAWRTFRNHAAWASLARPSLAVGAVLVVLFLIGPMLGEDRVGMWQRGTLLLAYAWQIAVAFRLHGLLSVKAAHAHGESDGLALKEAPDSG